MATSMSTSPSSARGDGMSGAYAAPVHHVPASSGAAAPNAIAPGHTEPRSCRRMSRGPPAKRTTAATMSADGTAFAVMNPPAHAASARLPVIAKHAAACARSAASTTPAVMVQKRSPARTAAHQTTAIMTGTNTRYRAIGQPSSSCGAPPGQPTRARSPVGSITAWTISRADVATTATIGRRA